VLRIPVLDKTINELRTSIPKREKLVQNLTQPILDLEADRARLAELEAQRAAAEAEHAQLSAERADLVRDVALFAELDKDRVAALRYLNNLVTICEHGHLGAAQPVATAHAQALQAAEHGAELRARLATMDARLKEIEG
jgi:DNA repair exonuclease SbcCD ATPase subunit